MRAKPVLMKDAVRSTRSDTLSQDEMHATEDQKDQPGFNFETFLRECNSIITDKGTFGAAAAVHTGI
jgi:hypothetical protein